MTNELASLRAAAAILTQGEGTIKQRLARACDHFWAALENPESWPMPLADRANEIVDEILKSSALGNPVKNMDERTALRVARDILRLAADMEAQRN